MTDTTELILFTNKISTLPPLREKPANGGIGEDPTVETYSALTAAHDHFNQVLFGGKLPHCMFTLRNRGRGFGYFATKRFGDREHAKITDEVALNPKFFLTRDLRKTLSTLVHEMVHQAQFHFGKPSQGGYHSREWAALMEAVGLMPSDIGEPGGKRTGSSLSHYIIEGGPFDVASDALLDGGFTYLLGDIWHDPDRKKRKSKTKFARPGCEQNAWGISTIAIGCLNCGIPMLPEVAR